MASGRQAATTSSSTHSRGFATETDRSSGDEQLKFSKVCEKFHRFDGGKLELLKYDVAACASQ